MVSFIDFLANYGFILLVLIGFALILLRLHYHNNELSPTITLPLGDRVYEVVAFVKRGEAALHHSEALRRFKQLRVDATEADARWILEHHAEVPSPVGEAFYLMFPDWHVTNDPLMIGTLRKIGGRWSQGAIRAGVHVSSGGMNGGRAVRRVK